MPSTNATRRTIMEVHSVMVRVRCGRCNRVMGRLYGDAERPVSFDNGEVEGMLVGGCRIDYFRRHKGCPEGWMLSWPRAVAAYRTAAAKPPQERVLTVPYDLPRI